MSNYPNLCALFGNVFGGVGPISKVDLVNDAQAACISVAELSVMENSIKNNPEFISGLPFLGEFPDYDNLVKSDIGFQLIQKYVDFHD
jgi:hypothetical protein